MAVMFYRSTEVQDPLTNMEKLRRAIALLKEHGNQIKPLKNETDSDFEARQRSALCIGLADSLDTILKQSQDNKLTDVQIKQINVTILNNMFWLLKHRDGGAKVLLMNMALCVCLFFVGYATAAALKYRMTGEVGFFRETTSQRLAREILELVPSTPSV